MQFPFLPLYYYSYPIPIISYIAIPFAWEWDSMGFSTPMQTSIFIQRNTRNVRNATNAATVSILAFRPLRELRLLHTFLRSLPAFACVALDGNHA